MFFAKQKSNQCGLHAIQNVLKTAAMTKTDMRTACDTIHKQTGDDLHNHETCGGDWSVQAVLQALRNRGFEVHRAVDSKRSRVWSGPSIDDLLEDDTFRGVILHQPLKKHFTCFRPEVVNDETQLYYVDSQSTGPRRISSKLAMRRCLAAAYSWEPFVVRGEPIEFVPAPGVDLPDCTVVRRNRSRPSESFLQEWRSFNHNA